MKPHTTPNSFLLEGLSTKRLLFRKVQPSDFDAWLPFHEDPESSKYWVGLPKDPRVACQQQFDRIFERYEKGLGGMNALILKTTGELVGLSGMLVQQVDDKQELEIAYSILPKFWNNGFASEAASLCKTNAFIKDWAETLISIIQVDNIPSQKVALKNGMHVLKRTVYNNNPVYIYGIHKNLE